MSRSITKDPLANKKQMTGWAGAPCSNDWTIVNPPLCPVLYRVLLSLGHRMQRFHNKSPSLLVCPAALKSPPPICGALHARFCNFGLAGIHFSSRDRMPKVQQRLRLTGGIPACPFSPELVAHARARTCLGGRRPRKFGWMQCRVDL